MHVPGGDGSLTTPVMCAVYPSDMHVPRQCCMLVCESDYEPLSADGSVMLEHSSPPPGP